ncbi:cupin domain-containing protein [Gordonia hongkongensis]|uniref:Cupin domain-containing protein n=1 Tax=Gordonia hongkongensis TaxID=1701090 RepID=A0AAX3T4C0_9ACTN|nr:MULTISPECIES: cupin domain-containing protein [Gordonia]OCW86852.1 cupin [Nocardia farcinica]QIK47303.1 cupin domain-containing protein [Gordonia terrae]WFP23662.1 cupin domain-containing protein [Gordonia hongkongensis]WGJ84362.1 cupin domain-containing protein [Gordonia sp. SMJS1]
MSAAVPPEWVKALDLQPHPEGGWFRETWRSDVVVPSASLADGYTGDRAAGTAIYFVLMPGDESAWHTVRGAELWLHHRGAPVELDFGGDADVPGDPTTVLVGPDIEAGHRPQALVPPGVWQRARPAGDEPSLVSCIVVPGFDFEDFRLA